jgi:hypothetical protein
MAGVLAGRLTRGVAAAAQSEDQTAVPAPGGSDSAYPPSAYPSAGGPGPERGFPPPVPPTDTYPPAGAAGHQPSAPGGAPPPLPTGPPPVAPGGPPASAPPGTGYAPPGGGAGYGPGHGGPAHAPHPGPSTVGEYGEDLERGSAGHSGTDPRQSEGGRR